jgi:hypothetical protein
VIPRPPGAGEEASPRIHPRPGSVYAIPDGHAKGVDDVAHRTCNPAVILPAASAYAGSRLASDGGPLPLRRRFGTGVLAR